MEIEQSNGIKILPWVFIALLYIAALYTIIYLKLAPGIGSEDDSDEGSILIVAGLVIGAILYLALIAAGIVNCVMAWVNCRNNREDYLCGCVVILKYATIPFHAGCAFLILAGMLIFIFGGMVLMLLGIILQASVFLVGICYAWSYIVVTVRNQERTAGMGVLHGLLLATYVADVIDTIVLMTMQRKYIVPSIIVVTGSIISVAVFIIRSGML